MIGADTAIAVVEMEIVSLFSLRDPTTNAHFARTLLCPSPAAIKMALLSALLWKDGTEPVQEDPGAAVWSGQAPPFAATGQAHLNWLKDLDIAWRPPPMIAVTEVTTRILKGDENTIGSPTKPGQPFERTVSMREYAHADRPFALAFIGIPTKRWDDFVYAVSCIRHLGVAESLVQPVAPPCRVGELPEGFVLLTKEHAESAPGSVARVIDDLGDDPEFERLSPFSPLEDQFLPRIGRERIRRVIALPLRVARRTTSGYTVEALRPTGDAP
jgi:hypothetical protein